MKGYKNSEECAADVSWKEDQLQQRPKKEIQLPVNHEFLDNGAGTYEEQFCVQPTEGGVTHSRNVKVQRGRRPAHVHDKLLVPPYGYVHGSPSGNTSATSATKSAERPVESNNASPLESGNVSKLE